jgi:hypothetical protein
MSNRANAIVLGSGTALLVVYEVYLLGIVNYRKMTDSGRTLSFVAVVVCPVLAVVLGWAARRSWRRRPADAA